MKERYYLAILVLKKSNFSKTQVGIRPEFINFSNDGIKVKIKRVSDTGRHKVIDTECSSGSIKILAKPLLKYQVRVHILLLIKNILMYMEMIG